MVVAPATQGPTLPPAAAPTAVTSAAPSAGPAGHDAIGGAGSSAAAPMLAQAGTPAAGSGAAAPAAPAANPAHAHDDCVDATPVALEDSMLTNEPGKWSSPTGAVELILPKPVQSWMDARLFKEGHDAWHAVRRCGFTRAGFGITLSPAFELCEQPKLVKEQQECGGTQDGYEFLVVHRHMINILRQAFPTHQDLFAGFPKFPFNAQDVPEPWRDRFGTGWSRQILDDAMMLEDIENQHTRFPTEGELGQFIQCGAMASGASSVHGALHFKWVVNGSPYALGDSTANLGNYMFWKLHGWIDQIWTRYRTAKGLKEDEPAHVSALLAQCREMHFLGDMIGTTKPTGPTQPLPEEVGVFHEQVRPIFENTCAGCHSGGSPEGGLVLGGQVSSAAIVGNLLDVQAGRGGQFKRVVARDPSRSWLYLKASGMAASAGCTGSCNAQVMPPTGMVTLTQAELTTIQRWIADGAEPPRVR